MVLVLICITVASDPIIDPSKQHQQHICFQELTDNFVWRMSRFVRWDIHTVHVHIDPSVHVLHIHAYVLACRVLRENPFVRLTTTAGKLNTMSMMVLICIVHTCMHISRQCGYGGDVIWGALLKINKNYGIYHLHVPSKPLVAHGIMQTDYYYQHTSNIQIATY